MTTPSMRARHIATNADAIERIVNGNAFTNSNGSFSARWIDMIPLDKGSLPDYAVPVIDALIDATLTRSVYAVFSYDTIIAIKAPLQPAYIPDENYSITTRRHQNIVRFAYGIIDHC